MTISLPAQRTTLSSYGIIRRETLSLLVPSKVKHRPSLRSLRLFVGHNESVGTISFAPVKGNYLLSGSADKTLKLWNIAALKKKAVGSESEEISSAKNTILAHDKDINCAKFSPNEKLIASASQDRTIKVRV